MSLGTKRIKVDNLPAVKSAEADPTSWLEYRDATAAAIAAAVPKDYRLLSVEEHLEIVTELTAKHTTGSLGAPPRNTTKVRHWALLYCIKGGGFKIEPPKPDPTLADILREEHG